MKFLYLVFISLVFSYGLMWIVAIWNPFKTEGLGGLGYFIFWPVFFILFLIGFFLNRKKISANHFKIVIIIAFLILILEFVDMFIFPFARII